MEAVDTNRASRISVGKIRRDGGTQPRAELNEEWATEIAERMAEGADFLPVTVYQDGTDLWLADGFHRCRGAEIAGIEYIAAYVVTGTRQDARDYANSGAPNGRHGLKESKADRWRRVENMLRDHADWSTTQVAKHCEVSQPTVSRVRQEVSYSLNKIAGNNRTVTRNGTTYTMNTGSIGKREEDEDTLQTGEEQDEPLPFGGDDEPLAIVQPENEPAHYLTIGTGQNEWYTPAQYIAMARDVMGGIDLDPATSLDANETVKADTFFTKDDDGLTKDWKGRVWLNPPYSRDLMPAFIEKLCQSHTEGEVTEAILVSHNNTDTNWFQSLSRHASAICFPKRRIRFYRDEEVAAPTNGQAFFYVGPHHQRFAEIFGKLGIIVRPV